jgi:hypothetical protein
MDGFHYLNKDSTFNPAAHPSAAVMFLSKNFLDEKIFLYILILNPVLHMKFILMAVVFGLCLVFSTMFGQSSKIRMAAIQNASKSYEVFGTIIVLQEVYVHPNDPEETYDKLRHYFEKPKSKSIAIVSDSIEGDTSSHFLEDSALAEFAMSGASDIKKFKGGFTIRNPFGGADLNAYIKSGIAWHPHDDRHVTYTIGSKTTYGYKFRNEHDFMKNVLERPILKLNEILEKPILVLINRLDL